MATGSVEVQAAVAELEKVFGERLMVIASDGTGAIVRISSIELSTRWSAAEGDLWFAIPFHYPDAPIYPYYVTGATPAGGMISGLQTVQWRDMPATQISLRHNLWNPSVDTALGSVMQTQAWLRSQ